MSRAPVAIAAARGPEPAATARRRRRHAGLSLIEMVTAISISGILTVGLAQLLRHPMNGYLAVSRRSELVSMADLAINRMTRDLRSALPNSVRVSAGGTVLELMHTRSGARYRSDPGINEPGPAQRDHSAASDWLSFGGDTRWNVLGRFQDLGVSYGSPLAAGHRVAIYPTGVDVWSEAATAASPGVITPATTTITIHDDEDEDQIELDNSHRFRFTSPHRRLFLVDTPITYLCDPTDASMWRIDAYSIASTQPVSRTAAPLASGSARRAADRVERCAFDYVPGSPSRAGLVTIELVLESAGERVRLLQQVQVQNAP